MSSDAAIMLTCAAGILSGIGMSVAVIENMRRRVGNANCLFSIAIAVPVALFLLLATFIAGSAIGSTVDWSRIQTVKVALANGLIVWALTLFVAVLVSFRLKHVKSSLELKRDHSFENHRN